MHPERLPTRGNERYLSPGAFKYIAMSFFVHICYVNRHRWDNKKNSNVGTNYVSKKKYAQALKH